MKRFEGRTVLVTGAARGQGRSHALHFAREGADVAICDICDDIGTVPYDLSTESDLAETVRLCEAEGAGVLSDRVDVRNWDEVDAFAQRALARFGQIDVLMANAGIFGATPIAEMPPEMFADMIGVNLIGVFHTIRAVLPSMLERQYGRIIATGSVCSITGVPNVGHYVAAKHGVAGLIKSVAKEVGGSGITANYLVPNGVGTKMIRNEAIYQLMSPDDPTEEASLPGYAAMNAIPKPWIEPEDVSKVVLFLASEDGRYTTGSAAKIDLGATA
jgi:SDR family mycofactocin-dependent oxidoreductase